MRWLLRRFAPRFTISGSAATVLGLSLLASTVAAGTTVPTTIPFTFTGTNLCVLPPDDFVGTGNLHVVVSSNLSSSGMVQSHLQTNLQGLRATTVIGGKKYQVPESSTDSLEFDSIDVAPFHMTSEIMLQFIRVGEAGTFIVCDDFFEHFLFHLTVNANGIVTVNDLTDDSPCR